MKGSKSKKHLSRKQGRLSETQEIEFLESWIDARIPDSGSNPLSIPPPPDGAPVGRTGDGSFSQYAGCTRFDQLPLSQNTKNGLKPKYTIMSEIQRASLPHSLCGRDVLGAAKTGSGKTLAFIIPVLEKLYRARWGPEDGVGSIIISPTRELAAQLFDELQTAGKHHNFSAGLLIGGRKDVDTEKDRVNELNILVCTPGRLLQHMDETPNFDCSQLQILVLDEADRILDVGFKKALNAIVSQLPKRRQTLLFSATQTKSVQDLARLSLKDPEYLSVHEESVTATPKRLQQTAMIVPLDQKLDILWSFIKAHLNSKILVFLSSCKQVKFIYEAFKKLRPGIPLKCLHGRQKQERRMGTYFQFSEKRSVLFSTDVASRGLDFPEVDWVVQVDCPEDVPAYIHRVGRTARFTSGGRSVLFLTPSETEMITKLQTAKVPIRLIKANVQRLQPVSGLLAALLVKYPDMQYLAQRAFATYLRSIYLQRDKEVFDVLKLPIEEFSASLGLPMTPNIRFLNQKAKRKRGPGEAPLQEEKDANDNAAPVLLNKKVKKTRAPEELILKQEDSSEDRDIQLPHLSSLKGKAKIPLIKDGVTKTEEADDDILLPKETPVEDGENGTTVSMTRILKKKKLKINVNRPAGTRYVYDEEGKPHLPLAAIADTKSGDGVLQLNRVRERYEKLKEEMKQKDKEDKLLYNQQLREKRRKKKMKLKRGREEEEDSEVDEDGSGSEREHSEPNNREGKKSKICFNSESEDDEKKGSRNLGCQPDSISLAEQEALALKLLSSMHS